jgi:hypothetical protein
MLNAEGFLVIAWEKVCSKHQLVLSLFLLDYFKDQRRRRFDLNIEDDDKIVKP